MSLNKPKWSVLSVEVYSHGAASCRFIAASGEKLIGRFEVLPDSTGESMAAEMHRRFIRSDSQVFLFLNSKCKRYFHNKLKPSKLAWTAMYRKQHKKDAAQEAVKRRRRATKKPYSRSIVGATLEVIQKKRAEKPEVRDAAREAALREIKEIIKNTKDEKKAKKVKFASKQEKVKANFPKAAAAGKGPKLGGGGGKR